MPNLKLHHIGIVVRDTTKWLSKNFYENELRTVVDPIQNAKLTLLSNYGEVFIEVIEPLSKDSYTWNSLIKNGNHINHLCYQSDNPSEIHSKADNNRWIHIRGPLEAILFDNRKVEFFYTRSKQVIEFLY